MERYVRGRKQSGAVLAAGLLWAAVLAGGCGSNEAKEQPSAPAPIQVGKESVATVKSEELRTGPIISGQLSAEREATVRAEVGGAVVLTAVDEGETVRNGAVLARIEARDLNDAVVSAKVAVQSAEAALKLAQSEAQRTESLVKGGALAQRDLENALNAVATAQSQLAAARACLSSADAQLADTVVRAPIAGAVSDKAVNTGDIVTPGTALYTIIDPSSMRLEASVPSDAVGALRPGVPVEFTVRGYGEQKFSGRIERISPAADPVTRQVQIFASIPNASGRLIAGLFAEGRVETEVRRGLVVPGTAVDETLGAPAVTRVRDGKAERVEVKLGIRDRDTERVEIVSGLSEGDVLLIGAARTVTAGTPVSINQ
jgi:membrane fusion protein, multidrug efflux system